MNKGVFYIFGLADKNIFVKNDEGEEKDLIELVYERRGIRIEKVYAGGDLIISPNDYTLIFEVALEWIRE